MNETHCFRRAAALVAVIAAVILPSLARAQEKTLDEIAAMPRHEQRAALEAYVASHPESTDGALHLGNWLFEENHLEDALKVYKKMLERDPMNFRALVNASICLEGLKRPLESVALFTDYLKKKPNDARATAYYGETLWGLGRKSEGMEEYRKAIVIDPKCPEAHLSLGNAFAEMGILREAIREWNIVIASNPSEELLKLAKENVARAELGL